MVILEAVVNGAIMKRGIYDNIMKHKQELSSQSPIFLSESIRIK